MNHTTVNRRYKIERKIGEGGMAEVYLGYDDLLHRPIAIKRLRPQYAADPVFRTRFEREAQAAASFSHPNIVDIYDVGEDGGTPYIVMEYIAGQTLKEIIEQEGPFDPDDVAILVEQVASALDYAHERGFVHRDIKPHNILVDADGLAKVVDFGIAKGLSDSTLTEAGSGLGTVHYLAPEQAGGLMATPESDIYSLGVVAYEMLTGRLPFEADSAVGIAMKHLHEMPRHPSDVNPQVPRRAGDVVMRALAKNPTERFPSAGEFARALDRWREYNGANGSTMRYNAATVRVPRQAPRTAVRSQPQPIGQTRPDPVAAYRPQATVAATAAATPQPRTQAAATASKGLGCASWLVGIIVVAGLIGLVWLGANLPNNLFGLASNNGEDREPTQVANAPEVTVTATNPARANRPTPTPPIVPAGGGNTELIVVPDLIGMTEEEALDALDPIGLVLDANGSMPSDTIEAGRIAEQDPQPGEQVEPGSAVLVHLSSGPPTVDLASLDLIGADPDAAEEALISRGLKVARGEIGSADVPEGRVAALDPSDSARPGDTVTLLVSVGDKVQIPREIQGGPLDDAVATLEGLGLTVANTFPVSRAVIEGAGVDLEAAGIEDGDVVGIQDNGADFGAWVPPGTSVSLVYFDASQED